MKTLVIAGMVVVFVITIVPATYWHLEARRRLSALGEQNPWFVYFLGMLAGRQYFTTEGWSYQRRANRVGLTGGVMLLVLFLLLQALRGGA